MAVMLAATIACLCLQAAAAKAQIGSARYSSIVIVAETGQVLSEVSSDEPRHPASLTKMMTLYMVFEALRDRRIALQQLVPVSPHAAAQSPTKLGLVPGSRITVQEAILGLITRSANDAAASLGEMLGGDEERFAQMMTLRARALGMSHSTFRNASGLPDPDQWTTAHDMATLGRRLVRDFPEDYRYFSTPSFRFRGKVIPTHDHMLETFPGADGIKTGYTEASGFNLVTSAVRGGVRLVGVVMGAAHAGERDVHMAALLNQAFERLDIGPPPRARSNGALVGAAQAAALPSRLRIRWAVQVGAFTTEAAARQAAAAARRIGGAGETHVEAASQSGHPLWRAMVVGLSDSEAHGTCTALGRQHLPCAALRLDPQQLASR
jgi:D-alanyl-D-alanine carboxypeptidase